MKKTLTTMVLFSVGMLASAPAIAEQITLSDDNPWSTVYQEADELYYYAENYTWEISDGEYFTASTASSSGTYGLGMNNSSMTIAEDASFSISKSSSDAGVIYGVLADNGECSITNEMDFNISVTNLSGSSYGIDRTSDCSSFTFNNNGDVDIDVVSGTTGYGIYLNGADSTFINNSESTINVNIQAGSRAYGIYLSGEGTQFENSGSIDVQIESNASSLLAYSYGLYIYNAKYSSFNNSGELSVDIAGTFSNYGIYYNSVGFTFENSGTIDVSVEKGTGLYLYSFSNAGSTFNNSGELDISASSYGINVYQATVTNTGNITIDTADTSVYLSKASFYNAGTLIADSIELASTSSFYMLNGSTLGANTEENESVSISRKNSGKVYVYLGGELDDATASSTDSSTITVTSGLEVASAPTVVLNDDVTLEMGGDLTLSGGVTTWNDHSLTVDNGGTPHTVTIGSALSATWDNALTISSADSSSVALASSDEAVTVSDGSITTGTVTITGTEDASVTLDGVAISVTDSASLVYCVVQGDSSIISTADEGGSLSFNDVTLVVDPEINASSTVDYTSYVITCDLLSGVAVDGEFTLDLSAYTDKILSGAYETVTVDFGDTVSLADDAVISASLSGYGTAQASGIPSGTTVTFLVSSLVPEPTTVSLSILGLGALLLRRRRD